MNRLSGYHFPVPGLAAATLAQGTNRRVICHIRGQEPIHCALMPNNGQYFILANKKLVSKLNLNIGDRVVLKLEKDHSEFGHPVPETFAALHDQDDDGRNYFYQLSPGKQRSLIYLIGTVKNIDSQLNKGMAILDHLKMESGHLDFKKLMALIKQYNQRLKKGI